MNPDHPLAAHRQDYFHLKASAVAVARAFGDRAPRQPPAGMVVLDLQAEQEPRSEVRIGGRAAPVVSFPFSTQGLVDLAISPLEHADVPNDWMDVYLPRSTFDRVADHHGAHRISELSLRQGGAVDDPVLSNLGACLSHALAPQQANAIVVVQIAQAVNTHIAEQYGGMKPPPQTAAGGLSPWQLRLARNTLDQHLDGSASIQQLANDCGLSLSHFSRAFTQSTGSPPHRWLMQRRVDVAKNLLIDDSKSLAEIALTCGFSDQSHFTKSFSRVTGVSPGRWRACRKQS